MYLVEILVWFDELRNFGSPVQSVVRSKGVAMPPITFTMCLPFFKAKRLGQDPNPGSKRSRDISYVRPSGSPAV